MLILTDPFMLKHPRFKFLKASFIYEKNQLRLIPNYFSSLNQMEVLAKKPKNILIY